MRKREQGSALIMVLFVLAAGLIICAGMMDTASTSGRTRAAVKTQAEQYYRCEETLNKTAAWLQDNSQNIVNAFTAANFANNFDIGSPSVGDNEGQHFQVPTLVKMAGTNNAAMLSNNAFFGESAFPTTTNIETGTSFNAATEFQNADLGTANARAVLMWARLSDGNYEPIFRVDAVTGNNPDRGAHTFTFVYSQLIAAGGAGAGGAGDGIGFYTGDGNLETVNKSNECYSYMWTFDGTSWDKGAPRSNCVVATDKNIVLESRINGDALSLLGGGVVINHPKGAVSGTVCEGADCHDYALPSFDDWSVTCNGHNQGSLVIIGNQTLMSGPALGQQCWEVVEVRENSALTLADKENPYHIKTLKFQNNSNSNLIVPVLQPDEKVTLYVNDFDGGQINGNQLYNTNNAPRCLEINITGSSSFKLNGNADMHAHFIAPLADVEHLGNFNFHGAIWASQFQVTGNGTFNFDEGVGGGGATPPVTDIAFTVKKASQRYR